MNHPKNALRPRFASSKPECFVEPLEARWMLASTPYSGAPAPLLGVIQAETFDLGGEGVAYHDTTAANEGGAFRAEGVDVETTGDTGGGYDVGYVHAGEWINYTVNAASSGNVDLAVRVADAVQGGTFHVEIDGANVTGALTIPNTGGWQNFTTITKTGIAVAAGNHVLKLVMENNGQYGFVGNINWMQFTASGPGGGGTLSPYGGTPAPLPGVIQLENFDNGGEGVAYHDSTPANEGGAFRTEGVDVEATSDAGGGFDVGYTHAGEWMKYSVNAPAAGSFDLAVRVADAVQGGTFHVEVDGVNVTGAMTVPNTGAWQGFTTISKTGIAIGAGNHVIRVAMDTDGQYGFVGNFNWMQFTPSATTGGGTSTPYFGSPVPLAGVIQAENFDNGGEGTAFHDTEAANLGGAYRNDGVDVETTTDTGGGFDVAYTHAGEWMNYTVNAASGGNYDLSVRVADAVQGGAFHVEIDGVNVSGGLTVPNTGGWQNYTNVIKIAIPVSAGNHIVRLVMDGDGQYGFVGNFNWMQFTPSGITGGGGPLNLLFFGNSFTLFNNVPSMVSQIAAAAGHATPNVFTQATYGWSLADHLNKISSDGGGNIIASSLPAGQRWDDVVIQELSTGPSSVTGSPVFGNPTAFRNNAAALLRLVKANSPAAHDILEETWARGYANPFYPSAYANPAAMQNDLLAQYNGAAYDAINTWGAGTGSVATVGEVWRAQNFDPNMYDGGDQYHPSRKGSLAAALVLERAIYHDRTNAIPFANVAGMINGLNATAATGANVVTVTASDWAYLTALADSVE